MSDIEPVELPRTAFVPSPELDAWTAAAEARREERYREILASREKCHHAQCDCIGTLWIEGTPAPNTFWCWSHCPDGHYNPPMTENKYGWIAKPDGIVHYVCGEDYQDGPAGSWRWGCEEDWCPVINADE